MDILKKKDICNTLIIVTRYFGGILLGTGGLVKAYSDATLNVLEKCSFLEIRKTKEYEIECEYKNLDLIKYYINKNEDNISINNIKYENNIILDVFINNEQNLDKKIINELSDMTINIMEKNSKK